MRNRIVFCLKNRGALAPFHYQFMIDKIIRKLIALGERQEFIDYEDYNFSSLKGQIRIQKGGVCFLSQYVTLVFSTSSKTFMDYFIGVLFDQKTITIGNLQLVPDEVISENPISFSSSMRFLCVSPIVLMSDSFDRDEIKRFVSPETDEFSDFLYESTINRMKISEKYSAEQLDSFYKFQLVADQEYLDRLEKNGKKHARIFPVYQSDKKLEVRGYTFPFTMYAPETVQQFIYDNGIGYFCHKGFGMIDLVSDKVERPVRRGDIRKKKMPIYA